MRNNANNEPLRKAAGQEQLWLQLGLVGEVLHKTVIAAGLIINACGNQHQLLADMHAVDKQCGKGNLASSRLINSASFSLGSVYKGRKLRK